MSKLKQKHSQWGCETPIYLCRRIFCGEDFDKTYVSSKTVTAFELKFFDRCCPNLSFVPIETLCGKIVSTKTVTPKFFLVFEQKKVPIGVSKAHLTCPEEHFGENYWENLRVFLNFQRKNFWPRARRFSKCCPKCLFVSKWTFWGYIEKVWIFFTAITSQKLGMKICRVVKTAIHVSGRKICEKNWKQLEFYLDLRQNCLNLSETFPAGLSNRVLSIQKKIWRKKALNFFFQFTKIFNHWVSLFHMCCRKISFVPIDIHCDRFFIRKLSVSRSSDFPGKKLGMVA